MTRVAVIGAGPAGITAAMYLARSGCSVILFEKLTPGGQILQTADLENYPGFPKGVKGYELADLLDAHLAGLAVERSTAPVIAVEGKVGDFRVRTADTEHPCAAVVVCTGARHRPLGLDGEDRLRGRGVSYCAICDGNFYRGQSVAVVGGGNAALEESLYLANIVDRVHLIHRRSEFRGARVYQDKLAACADKVELVLDSVVTGLLENEAGLSGVTVSNVRTGESRDIPVQGLFVYVGMEPCTDFLPAGVERDRGGFIVTDTEMRTSVPGIFAAGDVRSKLCRQVITAAGDGATAAQAAFVMLEQM